VRLFASSKAAHCKANRRSRVPENCRNQSGPIMTC
jgi:hypothetical protein